MVTHDDEFQFPELDGDDNNGFKDLVEAIEGGGKEEEPDVECDYEFQCACVDGGSESGNWVYGNGVWICTTCGDEQ